MRQLDARQLDVQVSTAALQHPVDVRILLPDGTATIRSGATGALPLSRDERAPVRLDQLGNAEQTTAGLPLIASCRTRASTATAAAG